MGQISVYDHESEVEAFLSAQRREGVNADVVDAMFAEVKQTRRLNSQIANKGDEFDQSIDTPESTVSGSLEILDPNPAETLLEAIIDTLLGAERPVLDLYLLAWYRSHPFIAEKNYHEIGQACAPKVGRAEVGRRMRQLCEALSLPPTAKMATEEQRKTAQKFNKRMRKKAK